MDQRVQWDHVDLRDVKDQTEPRDQLEIQESQDHGDLPWPLLTPKARLDTVRTSSMCT